MWRLIMHVCFTVIFCLNPNLLSEIVHLFLSHAHSEEIVRIFTLQAKSPSTIDNFHEKFTQNRYAVNLTLLCPPLP